MSVVACLQCGKTYSNIGNLNRHIKSAHDKVFYKCDLCASEFTDSGNLKKHVRSLHIETRFTCVTCNEEFNDISNLRRHIKSVHDRVSYSCSICGVKFNDTGNLARHIKDVHQKLKPFPCTTCGKAFLNSSKLQRHINDVHLKLKLSECTICHKSFTDTSKRQEHVDSVHLRKREHICMDIKCGLNFSSKGNLQAHINNVHSGTIEKFIKREEEKIVGLLNRNKIQFDTNVTVSFVDEDKVVRTARLDIVVQRPTNTLVIEVDEHAHGLGNLQVDKLSKCSRYSITCEQRRMIDASIALQLEFDKPVGFIRYNPHSFKFNGCTQKISSDAREKILLAIINNWRQEKELELQYMYYDVYSVGTAIRCCLWDHVEYADQLIPLCRRPIHDDESIPFED